MSYRIGIAIMTVIITGLAVASAVTLTVVARDRPLHQVFACAMHSAGEQEWRLPRTPCRAGPSATPAGRSIPASGHAS